MPKTKLNRQRVFNLPDVTLKVSENGLEISRFGFVVSKKVDKRAVTRNRVKRILRSYVQENLNNIKQGFDFLLISKKVPEENFNLKLEEFLKKEKYLK